MTRPFYQKVTCEVCGANFPKCPECGEEGLHVSTPFSRWLRNLLPPFSGDFYSLHNLDYVWNRYGKGFDDKGGRIILPKKEQWFMLMEEKRNGADQKPNQYYLHKMVSDCLHAGAKQLGIDYRGYYLVIFEKSTPSNSAWVKINKNKYHQPIDAIVYLLSRGSMSGYTEDIPS